MSKQLDQLSDKSRDLRFLTDADLETLACWASQEIVDQARQILADRWKTRETTKTNRRLVAKTSKPKAVVELRECEVCGAFVGVNRFEKHVKKVHTYPRPEKRACKLGENSNHSAVNQSAKPKRKQSGKNVIASRAEQAPEPFIQPWVVWRDRKGK